MAVEIHSLDEALARAKSLATNNSGRVIIGIIGKPGAGKSTLTTHLMKNLGDTAALVPMDGYHLSNAQLERLQRSDRKGAPDTFDSLGFANLMSRIKSAKLEDIYFPIFHREIEESIAAEGVVHPDTNLVITEGNYLLYDKDGWEKVADNLTESWYVQVDDTLRLERLVKRHHHYGKDLDAATAWAHGTDERNAQLVEKTKGKADVIIHLE